MFLWLVPIFLYGQESISNSSDKEFLLLKTTPNTEKKVNDLIQLFKKKAKKREVNYAIIDSAINIAKRINYTQGTGYAYFSKGLVARRNYSYYKAIKNQKIALPYLERAKDTVSIIKCLNSIGIAYRKANVVEKSFNHYFKAYKLAKIIGKKRSMAIALNGIGNLFTDIKKYDNALYYFRQALDLELSVNNALGIEYDYTNIGEAHLFLGNYDSAHFYIQKAYDLSLQNGEEYSECYEISVFGKIYQQEGKFKESNQYYKKALEGFLKIRNPRYISNTLINIGSNDIKLREASEGVKAIKRGLEIAKEIGSKENVVAAYENLSVYYSGIGNYKEALRNYKSATLFKDSILNEEAQRELISTKIAYDTYQKEEEIRELEESNQATKQLADSTFKKFMATIIVSLALFMALLVVFFLYRKNTRLEIENLNRKLQHKILQLDTEIPKEIPFEDKVKAFELTSRETEILILISKGFTNDEIAEELCISRNTVKYHSKSLYSKLNVKNRIQAIKTIKG